MANISDNTNLNGHVDLTADGKQNWISQINAGGTVYDIATHHGITFREGNDGAATVWNGLTDLEVVIPSIADIVQSPIEFAGTVIAGGEISWNTGHGETAEAGNLLFVTVDCTFAGQACEAGDMAIYDGTKWNIVSGENQVKIVGAKQADIDDINRTVVAVGAAKDVLVVEGKALSLTLDYADLNDNHVQLTKGDTVGVDFKNITVGDAYVKLSQGTGTKVTVGEDVKFNRATALKEGKVSINLDKVVTEVSFGEFTPGSFPTVTKNGVTNLDVTGGSVVAGAGNDYVSSVTVNPVTFDKANADDVNKITVLTSLTPGDGTEFFSGIHATTTDETADLTIKGYAVPTDGMNTKFVKGLEDGLTPVTSITAGDFKLISGSDLVTGLEGGVTGVVTAVSATVNNDTDVFSSASVTNHVLTFGTTKVASGVTVTPTITNFTKAGFQYTAPTATNTNFVTSGFTNVADTNYTFGRTKETTYSATPEMWKLNTPELTVNKGAYTLDRTDMKVTIGADLFATGLTGGVLPSLAPSNATKSDISATVGTELTFAEQTVHAVKATASEITLPGAYTLGYGSEGDGVLVGAAGEVTAKEATVKLDGYLTDVKVVATKTQA